MHLLQERMARAVVEEERIDAERTLDQMSCTTVRLYTERSSASAREIGVFCKAIAEEALDSSGAGGTVH